MLRNLGIRAKILATLSIPVLLLLVAAGVLIKQSRDQHEVAQSYSRVIDASGDFTKLVRGIQAERSLSMAVVSGDIKQQPKLTQTRKEISAGLSRFESKYSATSSVGVDRIWGELRAITSDLDSLRSRVDRRQLSVSQISLTYSNEVLDLLRIPPSVSQEYPTLHVQRFLTVVTETEAAYEATVRERDTLSSVLRAGGYSSTAEQEAAQEAILRRRVTGDTVRSLSTSIKGRLPSTSPLYKIESSLLKLPVKESPKVTSAALSTASSAEAKNLAAFETQQRTLSHDAIQHDIDAATSHLIWTILGSLLTLATMLLLALYMSRSLSAPLRRLTHAVGRVHTKLPEIVNQENPDQKVTLTEDMYVPVESDDEIGRLAGAFNDVNQAVVDTANSQAELRASISSMFVNVARRDQTLLSRQLSLIDQLERTEEDPQTLSTLFKLDHLSTRMRRNAEALLVLAGIDTGRRLRRAMALSDVVRTASSEIEHYDRVDLVQTVDPQMLGHTALSAASMLAELLENATAFSDPNSRVSVRTENSPGGVAVIITDEGLGMTQAEVDEANKKIASVSLAEVVASKRIGFFVVGRLARRLETKVVVSRGAGKGTMVRVEFPPQVFVPGAVTHVAGGSTQRQDGQAAIPASRTPQAQDSSTKALPAAPAATQPVVPPAATALEGPAFTPAPPAAAPAGAAAGLARRNTSAPAKPDAEERLSKAAAARAQAPAPAPAPNTIDAPSPDAAMPQVTDPGVSSNTQPMARRERPSQVAPESKVSEPLPQRPERPAAEPTSTSPAAPAHRAVPEQRPDSQGTRGGLFSSFRRTRDMPDPETTDAMPAARDTAADTAPTKVTPPAPPAAGPSARTVDENSGEADIPKVDAATDTGATAPDAAESAATPGSGARDILPGAGRKPATGRSGSLFSRLGDAPTAQTRSTTPPPAGAPAAAKPAASAPVVEGKGRPTGTSQEVPSPARRDPQEAPVQRLADTAGPAGPGFAAEALSELSRLQAYRPRTMPVSKETPETDKPVTLTRRQAGATPAGQLPPPRPQPSAARRGRSAADVRSMLSGFQAGVERGRSTTSEPDSEAQDEKPTT